MSRSNPNLDRTPNPAERFFEWKGGDGHLEYWDKAKKEAVVVKTPFTFIVLDQLATVKGYNKKMKEGFYSNEVRDTRDQRLVVKYFTGAKIAEGLWADIKDTVIANKGGFMSNVYVAYKDGKKLKLGAIQFQGCSLSPWFDFFKKNREKVKTQAVVLKPGDQVEGDITFTPPLFELKEISPETEAEAVELDKQLQVFLDGYFSRTLTERVAKPGPDAETEGSHGRSAETVTKGDAVPDAPIDDDVPF